MAGSVLGRHPLCRIKYNGQFLSNADQNLSDEYRSKITDIQDEISTVREYVGLYEHAPQMKAADVSDYRQLAAFGDTVLAATYSEKKRLYVLYLEAERRRRFGVLGRLLAEL